jgi:hypothetical protein
LKTVSCKIQCNVISGFKSGDANSAPNTAGDVPNANTAPNNSTTHDTPNNASKNIRDNETLTTYTQSVPSAALNNAPVIPNAPSNSNATDSNSNHVPRAAHSDNVPDNVSAKVVHNTANVASINANKAPIVTANHGHKTTINNGDPKQADTPTDALVDDGDDEGHEGADDEAREETEEPWQLASGPLSKEARLEAQKLGARVVEESERIARKFKKSRREILIAAGLAARAARSRNPCNMFKRWYAHKHPRKNTQSEYSCFCLAHG